MLGQSKVSEINQESLLTWNTLVQCVKAKYILMSKFKTAFDDTREITDCYINLVIVEEKERRKKEKILVKGKPYLVKGKSYKEISTGEQLNKEQRLVEQELEREAWLNGYEEIDGTKASVSLQDIYKPQRDKTFNRQLILGRAGIGKSTLCQYLAYQWAKEKEWKDESFKLLIWIPLRQLMNEDIYPREGRIITLGKLFYEQYKPQLKEYLSGEEERVWIHLLNKLIEAHQSEILYVLDGFDEVAHVCQLDDNRATCQTEILNQLLNQERVVITSRPYHIDNYLKIKGIKIDRLLENIGFLDKDIQKYVQLYPWKELKQQKALQSLLNGNRLMNALVHIPINLVLLCHYWSMQIVIEHDSNSMTDIYEGLVGNLLYEYLGKGQSHIDLMSITMSSILNNEKVQPILQFLEKLAFLQMQEENLFISKERIADLLEELKSKIKMSEWQEFKAVLGAGLLVSPDSQEKCFENRREHYFIHLTFQEFLAARYIASLFKQDDESSRKVALLERERISQRISSQPLAHFMQNNKYDLRYEKVWGFVAGLLRKHREGIERFFNSLSSKPRELSGGYDVLLWIKCLEESKFTANLGEVLKNNLIEEIKNIAQAALDSKVRISGERYSKIFFEYLYSSPMVYEALNILQTQAAVREARSILQWHLNLPIDVLEKMECLLKDKEKDVKILVLYALNKQPNLSLNVLKKLIRLLCDKDEDVVHLARNALSNQRKLPESILNNLIGLLKKRDSRAAGPAVEVLLANSGNLPDSILNSLVNVLREKNPYLTCLAQRALGQNLPDDTLNNLVSLLSDKNEDISRAAQEVLNKQERLPDSVLNNMVGLLSDEDKDVRYAAWNTLGKQQNLPDSILNNLVYLLNNKDLNVSLAILNVLSNQLNLPDSVVNGMVRLLSDKDKDIRRLALDTLGNQWNLADSMLTNMVNLLDDKDKDVRCSALKALGSQQNLLDSIFNNIINLLNDEERSVKIAALQALVKRPNLDESLLKNIMNLLSDKDEETRYGVLPVLKSQQNLPVSILNDTFNLLNTGNLRIDYPARDVLREQLNLPANILEQLVSLINGDSLCRSYNTHAAWHIFSKQCNLPDGVLNNIVSFLSNEGANTRHFVRNVLGSQRNLSDSVLNNIVSFLSNNKENARYLARDVLGDQKDLPDSALNNITCLLNNKNKDIKLSVMYILGKQRNLSDGALSNIVNLLSDKEQDIRNSVLDVLDNQLNLPANALRIMVNLLSDGDWNVKCSVLKALSKQPSLPTSVLSRVVTLITAEKEAYRPNVEEINFINHNLISILDNSELQPQLSLLPVLLSNVILKNMFSNKNVVYFENNQSLIIRLGQQLKQIAIKDKNKFIQVFMQERQSWLNNQNVNEGEEVRKEMIKL